LIELLVVIAVIAILAALLLPGLSLAKSEGQSTKCKSNLRELGLALTLYVQDYQKYPLFVPSPQHYWDQLLLPYAASNRMLFTCPANLSTATWTNFASGVEPDPNPSYGYNYAGTAKYQPTSAGLGLDGGPSPLRENMVKVPSDMVSISDYTNSLLGGDHDADDYQNLLMDMSPPRHNKGANAVFCDSHVEYAKWTAWTQASDKARQRWNNDHQPHRETWGSDP